MNQRDFFYPEKVLAFCNMAHFKQIVCQVSITVHPLNQSNHLTGALRFDRSWISSLVCFQSVGMPDRCRGKTSQSPGETSELWRRPQVQPVLRPSPKVPWFRPRTCTPPPHYCMKPPANINKQTVCMRKSRCLKDTGSRSVPLLPWQICFLLHWWWIMINIPRPCLFLLLLEDCLLFRNWMDSFVVS